MDNLPTDIIENILSRLPFEFSLRIKRVCKTWSNLIGNSKTGLLFAYADVNDRSDNSETEVQLYYGDQYEESLEQSHLNKKLIKLDRVKFLFQGYECMIGSCNGLVCLQSHDRVTLIPSGICNPVTREFLFLPGLTVPRIAAWRQIGFGYLSSTNEYKVVRINSCSDEGEGYAEIYTLGSQSGWRGKQYVHCKCCSPGIFANGAIHWIGQRNQGERRVYKIVAYDLADEEVKYVSIPPFDYSYTDDTFRLMLLGGNLCVIHYREGRDQTQDIWALQKKITDKKILQPTVTRGEYYDDNWNWSKDLSISFKHLEMHNYQPFAITKSNEVLLWHEHKTLYCYDNNTSTLTKLRDGGGDGLSCIQAIPT